MTANEYEAKIAELEAMLKAATDTAVLYKNLYDEARGHEWDMDDNEKLAVETRKVEKQIRKNVR